MTPDEAFTAYQNRTEVRDTATGDNATGIIEDLEWDDQHETLIASLVSGADFRRYADVLDLTEDLEADDDTECEGHESTSGPIGNVTYCDGTCR